MIQGVDETLCFSLKFKNGGMANVSCNATVSGENTAVIYGDKGNIKVLFQSLITKWNLRSMCAEYLTKRK